MRKQANGKAGAMRMATAQPEVSDHLQELCLKVATVCQYAGIRSDARYLEPQLLRDLAGKTVVLTGARQVGKTTLARQLRERFERAQYLNWDVPVDRAVLLRQS